MLEKLIQVNCNWNNIVAYKTNVKKTFFNIWRFQDESLDWSRAFASWSFILTR